MRLTVTARTRMEPALRTYCVDKLSKLERHDGSIHEARAVLEEDDRRVPRASAEVFVHIRHQQIMARCEGVTMQEAIDKVVDKIDRQIVRRKEKVKEHKGKPAAGSDPAAPGPRGVTVPGATPLRPAEPEPVLADPIAYRRTVTLRPMSVDDAIVAFENGGDQPLLFIDGEGGELCLLTRRADGELELVVGDTR
jgi:putative sigma-54 modulation protein